MSNEALIEEARTIQMSLGGDDKAATDARNVIGDLIKALEQSEWVSVETEREKTKQALMLSAAWGGDPTIPEVYRIKFRAISDAICPEPIIPPPAEVET